MTEKYFPGFEFKKFEPPKPIEIITVPYEGKNDPSIPIEIVRLDDFIGGWEDINIIEEPISEAWNSDEVHQEFTRHLDQIDRQIEYPRLTMDKRTMNIVSPDEMRPKTDEEREWLIQRYGDYVADGGIGDCTRNSNGTFTLRIGFAGQEDTIPKEDVLEVMGHEYGHTLGDRIDDPVLEELKAYTFANLFMRHYYKVAEYRVLQMDVSTVHETARFWLEQLLDKNISEEAIIAHLTGKDQGAII